MHGIIQLSTIDVMHPQEKLRNCILNLHEQTCFQLTNDLMNR